MKVRAEGRTEVEAGQASLDATVRAVTRSPPLVISVFQTHASARRAGQLADRPAAPRAFALEQTPLIRDAVSASEMLTQDLKDGKEPRREA